VVVFLHRHTVKKRTAIEINAPRAAKSSRFRTVTGADWSQFQVLATSVTAFGSTLDSAQAQYSTPGAGPDTTAQGIQGAGMRVSASQRLRNMYFIV